MRNRRWVTIGVIASSLAMMLAVSSSYADSGSGKGKGRGEESCESDDRDHAVHLDDLFFHKSHLMLRHEQELGLSDEQVERVKAIMAETRKRLIRDEADIDVLDVDLMRELHKPTVDVQATRSILDKQYEAKKARAIALAQSIADLKATLTPEQHAKLKGLYRATKE